ncbi:unnamed protein product [Tuber aestivum]|uniref:Uncharacterized protein n=1 Tax=Tuber aestivum TaxID=59557 RepID=A0A292PTU6_9PEZI|nr:unnamed protein product [Tuber aestivum]
MFLCRSNQSRDLDVKTQASGQQFGGSTFKIKYSNVIIKWYSNLSPPQQDIQIAKLPLKPRVKLNMGVGAPVRILIPNRRQPLQLKGVGHAREWGLQSRPFENGCANQSPDGKVRLPQFVVCASSEDDLAYRRPELLCFTTNLTQPDQYSGNHHLPIAIFPATPAIPHSSPIPPITGAVVSSMCARLISSSVALPQPMSI